jgi:radical SAM superfamily enzyme YgiQ (UPF0313 family)
MKVALVSLGSSDRYGGFNRRMLGPAYLEATIRRDPRLADRCEVVHLVFDGRVAPPHDIAEQVLASGCDVVGFGCYVWCTERAVAAARHVKQARPSVQTVLGGPGASALHTELLEQHDHLDLIVLGEGELTFPEYLRWRLEGRGPEQGLAGAAWRDAAGAVASGPRRPLIDDLGTVPSPYLDGLYAPEGVVCMETFRGCPFLCSFCAWGEREARYFPLERVKAELDVLNRPEVPTVFFVDSILNLNPKRCHAILEHIRDIDFQPWIWVEFYPRLIDERSVELLRQIGKVYMGIGIQSVTRRAMDAVRREFDPDAVAELLAPLADEPDLVMSLESIAGLPEDGIDGYLDTTSWIFAREPRVIVTNELQVIPGSDLLNEADAMGLEVDVERGYTLLSSPTMSAADVARARHLVAWVRDWSAILARTGRFSGLPVGEVLRGWDEYLTAHELQGMADGLDDTALSFAQMHELIGHYGAYLRGLAIAPDGDGVAERLYELQRYIVARILIVEEQWQRYHGLDVTGIQYRDVGHVDAPWREGCGEGVALPDGPLQATVPMAVMEFGFDVRALLEACDVDTLLAVPRGRHLVLVFHHPEHKASRCALVDDAENAALDAMVAGEPVSGLDAVGRAVAAGMIGLGIMAPLPTQAEAATTLR